MVAGTPFFNRTAHVFLHALKAGIYHESSRVDKQDCKLALPCRFSLSEVMGRSTDQICNRYVQMQQIWAGWPRSPSQCNTKRDAKVAR